MRTYQVFLMLHLLPEGFLNRKQMAATAAFKCPACTSLMAGETISYKDFPTRILHLALDSAPLNKINPAILGDKR